MPHAAKTLLDDLLELDRRKAQVDTVTPDQIQIVAGERRFLLEKVFQFINFGLISFGLGLNACFSNEAAAGYRSLLSGALGLLFLGATFVTIVFWLEHHKLRAREVELLQGSFRPPQYWWIFLGAVSFGVISTTVFATIWWQN